MSIKRFFFTLLAGAVIFISGVLIGKYILSPPVEIVIVDIEKLGNLIERYSKMGEEVKKEFKAMKEWNESALVEPPKPLPKEEVK